MKLKVILPTDLSAPAPSLGLGTLMSLLHRNDEIVLTARQIQMAAICDDVDVVVIAVGSQPIRAFNLAEFYRTAGAHVVLIGSGHEHFEDAESGQTIFLGAADELWAAFLRDFRRGEPGYCYTSDFTVAHAASYVGPMHAA